MKSILLCFLVILFVACSNEQSDERDSVNNENETQTATTDQNLELEFPRFESVYEMLESAGDYNESDGNLVSLSTNDQTHVQVSKWVFENDIEETITRQVQRNVVYVAFQAFAETNIDELTITSLPLLMRDVQTRDRYLNEFKETVTINRGSALAILEKYLNTESFQDLYALDSSGQIWLPNNKFDQLKYDRLSEVFRDMAHNE